MAQCPKCDRPMEDPFAVCPNCDAPQDATGEPNARPEPPAGELEPAGCVAAIAKKSPGETLRPSGDAWPVAIVLVIVLAAIDLLGPVVLSSGGPEMLVVGMAFFGLVTAQFGFLAIWAVFGPQRLIVRLPGALGVAVLLSGILFTGIVLSSGSFASTSQVRNAAQSLLMVPLMALTVLAPLWLAKILTGGRIIPDDGTNSPSAAALRQFGLQDMLILTAVVAATLGLARAGLSAWNLPEGPDTSILWMYFAGQCLVMGVACACYTLPCIWTGLAIREAPKGCGITIAFILGWTLLLLVIVLIMAPGPPPAEFVVGVLVFHGTLMSVLFGSLRLVRACGYKFVRAGRRKRPA